LSTFYSFNALSERIKRILSITDENKIEMFIPRGSIDVHVWNKPKILIKGRLDQTTKNFIFKSINKKIVIRNELNQSIIYAKNLHEGSYLTLWLPNNIAFNFSGTAIDLKIEALKSNITIDSVTGDIKVIETEGALNIHTISGKITLKKTIGSLKITTVSGHLRGQIESKNIDIQSISGNIHLTLPLMTQAKLKNISGNIFLKSKQAPHSSLMIHNISGESYYDTQLKNATLLLSTGITGTIVGKYVKKVQPSYIGTQNHRWIFGKGLNTIHLKTLSGRIGIKPFRHRNRRSINKAHF
jgi:DUF4097 and DUF4098 domain-containing protein YvlB